jgi:lipopolysaccharide export system protein LptA
MKTKLCLWIAAAFLVASAAVFADDHKVEGKILRMDTDAKAMVVQGEKGDQATFFFTPTTKIDEGLTFADFQPGDKVEIHYIEKDGQKYLAEVEREHKAK